MGGAFGRETSERLSRVLEDDRTANVVRKTDNGAGSTDAPLARAVRTLGMPSVAQTQNIITGLRCSPQCAEDQESLDSSTVSPGLNSNPSGPWTPVRPLAGPPTDVMPRTLLDPVTKEEAVLMNKATRHI